MLLGDDVENLLADHPATVCVAAGKA